MNNTKNNTEKTPLKNNTKQHQFTKEEHIKGGQSRSIMKSIVKRRKCDKKCKLFDHCPFASMGIKYNTCYLNCKEYPTLKKNVEKLMSGDQNDFYDIARNVFADMLRIAETEDDSNLRSKKIVMESLEKLHNMQYGTKGKLEHSGKVDIELFKKYLKEDKE